MIACGWKYVYDGFSSKTFPDWGSAVRDLIDRFPNAARFPEYYVSIEPREDPPASLRALKPDEEYGPSSFSRRV